MTIVSKVHHQVCCPLCSGVDLGLVCEQVWSMDGGRVYRCRSCDLTFIDPAMNDQEEKEFYKNYSKHVVARGAVATDDPAELHRKGRIAAADRFSKIKEYFKASKRILEIGASTGAFLELLQGKDLYGVEPADTHRRFLGQFCKKVYSDLAEVPAGEKFEVICLFHVFEHIRKPLDFLEQCGKLLGKGGKLIIEVPHIEDPLLTLYHCEAFKSFYFQPMHPYVYSRKSLEKVFTQAGFRVDEFIYYQRYGLDNHLTWLTKGRPGADQAFSSVFRDQTAYKADLERAGLTDTIFCVVSRQEDHGL